MYKYWLFIFFILLTNNILSQTHKVLNAKATYYSKKFDGRRTYSGERFYSGKYTAAHRSFPLQSLVKVINPKDNKYVIVRINDRFRRKNFIDLSYIAAKQINIISSGIANVKIQLLDSTFMQEYKNQSLENALQDTAKYEITADTAATYYVRVASMKFKKNAQKFIKSDLHKDFRSKASIRKTSFKRKPLYKVLIGPYDQRRQADSILYILSGKYKDARIIE